MRTRWIGLAVWVLAIGFGGNAGALVVDTHEYSYTPSPADLYDLDHYKAYGWGITTNVDLTKQTIVSARLMIDNINDWEIESTDTLFIHLLDNAYYANGVKVYTDNQNPVDYFSGKGTYLTKFVDDNEYYQNGTQYRPGRWVNPSEDFVYDFTAADLAVLAQYIMNDGKFGLGFDPDCHYYNDGVTLQFCTVDKPVPEPATMLLLGMGVTGLVVRRFRRQ